MDKTLVIMAAGMGSRYGGLKQVDPVGPGGSIIIDYSIYDAVKAGFNKVVFIIKKENEQIFREVVGDKVAKHVKVEYVFQSLDAIPDGFTVPEGRVKPWGTAHAVLCCKGVVNEPFVVINADDFYGRSCFQVLGEWIDRTDFAANPQPFAMAGFYLKNTLTENGTVSRGVCEVSPEGFLTDVVERTKIIRRDDGQIAYTEDGENWTALPENSYVSMNCWALPASFIDQLDAYFADFLRDEVPNNPLKAEVYLPFVIRDMLEKKVCTVEVLETTDRWFGVTYAEDKPQVVASVRALIDVGVYPERLWDE